MSKDYMSTLKEADNLAQIYLEKGADSVSYGEFSGFEVVMDLYFQARYDGNEMPETIIHCAEFRTKDILQILSEEKRFVKDALQKLNEDTYPHISAISSRYISFRNLMDEAIEHAAMENKKTLIEKRNELFTTIENELRGYEERTGREFTSKLEKVDKMAKNFFDIEINAETDSLKHGNSNGINALVRYYADLGEFTYPGSDEELQYNCHYIEIFIKHIFKILETEPAVAISIKNKLIESCFALLDSSIEYKKIDVNSKAKFIKKRKEYLDIINNEFRKHKDEKIGCYIATAVYGSYDCPQVWTLRRYRDNLLRKSLIGRQSIRVYYTISPILVKMFGKTKWFNCLWLLILNKLVQKLHDWGYMDTPYTDSK